MTDIEGKRLVLPLAKGARFQNVATERQQPLGELGKKKGLTDPFGAIPISARAASCHLRP